MTIQDYILKRIRGRGRGAVFTPSDFLDLGSRDSVDQALSRLSRKGVIRRLDRGVYDFPVVSQRVGNRSPNAYAVAESVAGRLGARVQHSGAYTAYILGLSDQVPAKAIFLTDGPNRTIRAGNHTVELKHAGHRSMIGAGSISGHVQQALRYLGRSGIDGHVASILRQRLSDTDKRRLQNDAPGLPAWIQDVIWDIVRPEMHGVHV